MHLSESLVVVVLSAGFGYKRHGECNASSACGPIVHAGVSTCACLSFDEQTHRGKWITIGIIHVRLMIMKLGSLW